MIPLQLRSATGVGSISRHSVEPMIFIATFCGCGDCRIDVAAESANRMIPEESDPNDESGSLQTPDIRRQLQLDDVPLSEAADQESSWGRTGGGVSYVIIVICSVVGGLILIGLVLQPPAFLQQREEAPPALNEPPSSSDKSVLEEVRETVRGFMEAPDHAHRAKYVVAPQQTLEKMEEFYARPGNLPPEGIGRIIDIGPAAFDGFPMHMVVATAADQETVHIFSVFPVGRRQLIDWESSVGYGGMAWEQFVTEKPRQAVELRINLKRDYYHVGSYSDDSKWTHYRMRSRDPKKEINCYVAADSLAARKLAGIVKPGAVQPVTVAARWDEKREAVRLLLVVHPFWVDLDRLRQADQSAN